MGVTGDTWITYSQIKKSKKKEKIKNRIKFKLEVTDIAATTQKSYSNMLKKNIINGSKNSVPSKQDKQFDPMTIDPQEVKPD